MQRESILGGHEPGADCWYVYRHVSLQPAAEISIESLQALRQAILSLQELLISSGVGALPILPEGAPTPTEAELLEMTTKAHNQVWSAKTRTQEASAVAANILSMPDRSQR